MDFTPFVPHMEVPVPEPKDYGFGLAPTTEVFDAAYDVLEWEIWGPFEENEGFYDLQRGQQ